MLALKVLDQTLSIATNKPRMVIPAITPFRLILEVNHILRTTTQAISNAVYKGGRQHFTLENYPSIMAKAFNYLKQAGPAHVLTEQQKITKFEGGLRDDKAIS